MKDRLPGRIEIAVLLAVIVICAALVSVFPKVDLAMAAFSIPISIIAGLMGLRRCWRLQEVRQEQLVRRPPSSDEDR